MRRLGSAALDLVYVAAGRFEAFWEQHLKPWDVAAGALIVEEAGGLVTGMDGAPFDAAAAHLIASNGHVHREVVDTIDAFRRERAQKRDELESAPSLLAASEEEVNTMSRKLLGWILALVCSVRWLSDRAARTGTADIQCLPRVLHRSW